MPPRCWRLWGEYFRSQFFGAGRKISKPIPNPENEEAMRSVSQATVRAGADLGVIFDTDVDRGGAVDKAGEKSTATVWWRLPRPSHWRTTPAVPLSRSSITSDGLEGLY